MELTRTPAILKMDWQAAAENKGLNVKKLNAREADSFERACRMPGITLCAEFGVCRGFRVQAGTDGWDRITSDTYMIVHRPSGRPLVWGVKDVDEGVGIVTYIVGVCLDWDFTTAEFQGLPEKKKEKYREVVRAAVDGTGAKSALLNGECAGQQQAKAIPAPNKAVGSGTRRVSLAPSRAGTNKVSLLP